MKAYIVEHYSLGVHISSQILRNLMTVYEISSYVDIASIA